MLYHIYICIKGLNTPVSKRSSTKIALQKLFFLFATLGSVITEIIIIRVIYIIFNLNI